MFRSGLALCVLVWIGTLAWAQPPGIPSGPPSTSIVPAEPSSKLDYPLPRQPLQFAANVGPHELLPKAPQPRKRAVLLSDEVAQVPEIEFGAALSRTLEVHNVREAIIHPCVLSGLAQPIEAFSYLFAFSVRLDVRFASCLPVAVSH